MSETVTELPHIEFVESPIGPEAESKPKRGRPPGSKAKMSLAALEESLADKLLDLTIPFAITSPLATAIAEERAERTAKALVQIASGSPRFHRALERAVKGGAILEIAMFPAGIAVGHLVDYGKVNPNSSIARRFHVPEHWNRLYGEDGDEIVQQNGASPVQTRSGLV